jgi:hypothetical protein
VEVKRQQKMDREFGGKAIYDEDAEIVIPNPLQGCLIGGKRKSAEWDTGLAITLSFQGIECYQKIENEALRNKKKVPRDKNTKPLMKIHLVPKSADSEIANSSVLNSILENAFFNVF